jgi:4-hydroxybenzoate polyprenyltransferase
MGDTAGNFMDSYQNIIHTASSLFRWKEWFDSKVPLFFVAFYYLCLNTTIPTEQVILRFVLSTAFGCAYLAFGYFINDYFDRDLDRAAGKQKAIQFLSDSTILILLTILGLFGSIIALMVIQNKIIAVLFVAVAYFLGIYYSKPPIRFKERGVWGLAVASFAQRAVPVLLMFVMFQHYEFDSLFLLLLFALIGLRWILVHQFIDLKNDQCSGISTFATQSGYKKQTIWLTKWVVFPLELVCLAPLLYFTAVHLSIFWFLPILYGLVVLANWFLWKDHDQPYRFTTFARQPLEDFYYVYWPLGLVLILAFRQPIFWFLFLFNLFWQGTYILNHSRTVIHLAKSKIQTRSKYGE